jgi:CO/xanthine dehydrogenase FAD-binding subunit
MQVLRPTTPREAVAALVAHPQALPVAGGTDLMVAWNAGKLDNRTILDLSALRDWARVEPRRDGVRIGALATHAQLREDSTVRRRLPLLAAGCAVVGGVAIQNRGTIGGNLANASPAGDTFPPLAVYDAMVHVLGPAGARSLPLLDLFAGPKRTTLRAGELIEAVDVHFPMRPSRQLFRKVGTRAAQALSKVVAAGLLWLDDYGRVTELRFALGSVAPTVRRLHAVEELVTLRKLTPALAREAVALLEREIAPIDDVRSTARYRMEVSRNLLWTFLAAPPPEGRAGRPRRK